MQQQENVCFRCKDYSEIPFKPGRINYIEKYHWHDLTFSGQITNGLHTVAPFTSSLADKGYSWLQPQDCKTQKREALTLTNNTIKIHCIICAAHGGQIK